MSNSVDQRIVEMRFDNKHFENNVSTSMSTLDKLKAKLNFKGAEKGFDNIRDAAEKVNMNGLSGAVDTVRSRFSALEIMGVTALVNITNSAVNAGKQLLKSLTIEPITTGFKEYELKMDSVRTIMASTGESLSVVNKYLEELNEYSDQTIYSFSDMTQNIGKFTNAGVKLEDAVMAIKGISNEAALSGANANEASRAMYNFAQALSAGHVKLIDWKSIELANMATKEFKEQLLESAVAAGTLTKSADGVYNTLSGDALTATQNFNETLQEQWMTTEVLVGTLKDYADETTDIGARAFAAAQDVTKFTQMIDVLKETAQSGWAKTWELVFGDIEQAKSVFVPLTQFFSGIIAGISDFRNNLLEGALSSPLGQMAKKIANVTSVTTTAVEKMKDYGDMVNRVINGELGNGESRWNQLAQAGYDWMHVQNLVNEELNDATRYATDYTESTEELVTTTIQLTDAKLEELGLTEEEIKAYRNLEMQARRTGVPIEELLASMDGVSGRTLLIDALKNAGSGVIGVFTAMKDAWLEAFPPMTSTQLYNIISGMNELSKSLRLTDEGTGKLNATGDKIRRTLRGVFAILDIITTITGGALKIGLKVLGKILGNVDLNLLDVTAAVGDAVAGFRDFLFENNLIVKALDKLIDLAIIAGKKIGEFAKAFVDLPIVRRSLEKLKDTFSNLSSIGEDLVDGITNGLKDGTFSIVDIVMELGRKILTAIKDVLGIHSPSKEMEEVGANSIQGFVNGIQNGFGDVVSKLKELGGKAIETVKNIDFGPFIALGIGGGTIVMLKKIGDALDTIGGPIKGFNGILDGFGDVLHGGYKVLKAYSTEIKSKALLNVAIALLALVGAIAVLTLLDTGKVWASIGALAGMAVIMGVLSAAIGKFGPKKAISFGAFALAVLAISASLFIMAAALSKIAKVDPDRVIDATMALVLMVGSLALMLSAFSIFVKGDASKSMSKAGGMLIKMSIVIILLAFAMKQISKLQPKEIHKGFAVIVALGVFVAGLMAATRLLGKNASGIGWNLLLLAGAMWALTLLIDRIKGMKNDDLIRGGVVLVALGVFITALMWATKLAGDDVGKVGGTLLLLSAAMAVLVFVMKQVADMSWPDLGKGLGVILVLSMIFEALIVMTNSAGPDAVKVGVTLLLMSLAIGVMVGIMALLTLLPLTGIAKGVLAIGGLALIFSMMIKATKDAKNVKGNLIAMSVAIAVMAASIAVLSLIDGTKLAGATLALATVMGMFALMTKTAGNAQNAMGSIIAMTVVIGVLGGVIYLLSKLPIETTLASAGVLSVLLLSLSASMFIISKVKGTSTSALAALGIMALAIGILGGALYLLAQLPMASLITSAVGLSLLILTMSGAMLIMSKMGPSIITGAASFAILAAAIWILAPALVALGSMSIGQVGIALLALAGAFTVMGVAGLVLRPLAPVIVVLSAAIALLGVGCLAAGLGVQLFSNGLASLAVTGPIGAMALVVAVTTILGLIPLLMAKIGEGIIAFAGVIANGAPAIIGAITTVFLAILSSISDTVPALITTVGVLLDAMLSFLLTYIPKLIDAGFTLVMCLLEGISANIGKVTETAIDIVVKFIDAVAEKLPEVIDSGIKLIISFVNGVAEALRGNTEPLRLATKNLFSAIIEAAIKFIKGSVKDLKAEAEKFIKGGFVQGVKDKISDAVSAIKEIPSKAIDKIKEWITDFKAVGKDIVDGLINGIAGKVSGAVKAAKDLAKSILNGAKKALGINSPSREFMDVAKYSVMGLSNGLTKFAKNAVNSAKDLGNKTTNSLSNAMARVSEIVNGDMDTQPTIRPVLDLSDVKSGASSISNMLHGRSLAVSAQTSAGTISDSMLSFQNGNDNSDVVSAIKGLRKDLSNISSNTYNVNGVTYDDGSNIVDAVKSLVRATKIERRV